MVDHGPTSEERTDSGEQTGTAGIGDTLDASRRTVLKSMPAIGGLAASPAVGTVRAALDLPTVDTTSSQDATFSESNGTYTIEAAGADLWKNDDEYGAIYQDDGFKSETTVRTTVESQENTDDWARAGVMVANDMTAAGSSAGDILVAVTPGNGFVMQWDSDGDGYMESSVDVRSTTYPCTLKLERSGNTFTGSFSTDGGDTFTEIDSVHIAEANDIQDAGIVDCGLGELCTVTYSHFAVELAEPTVDTTGQQNATFEYSNGQYTIEAAGEDLWRSNDEYGAIYEDDEFQSESTVVTTVESQENTSDWRGRESWPPMTSRPLAVRRATSSWQ
jgi:hypothetical protein